MTSKRSSLRTGWVLGLDACTGGWAGIAWSGSDHVEGLFATTVHDALAQAERHGRIDVIGIDIPIGLPDSSVREADTQARTRLGRRGSSVFTTPVRAAVEAESYAQALEVNRRATGLGISKQAYGLRTRILDADEFVHNTEAAVVEVHPELSFARMSGSPLNASKRTWEGMTRRRALLAAEGIVIPDDLGRAGPVAGIDDVLDAAAAAWTAQRVLRGEAESLPASPERFSDGWPAAIWT